MIIVWLSPDGHHIAVRLPGGERSLAKRSENEIVAVRYAVSRCALHGCAAEERSRSGARPSNFIHYLSSARRETFSRAGDAAGSFFSLGRSFGRALETSRGVGIRTRDTMTRNETTKPTL